MLKLLTSLAHDESGATAIEYGLIAALISVALVAGATTLGGKLNDTFGELGLKLSNATTKTNL